MYNVFISAIDFLPSKITTGRNVQYFNLSLPHLKNLHESQILKATLFVHLPKAPMVDDTVAWIDTHMITLNKGGEVVPKRMDTDEVDLTPDYGGWADINVTPLVKEWIEDRTKNSPSNYIKIH